MEKYGTIRIKLDELIKKAGISKNRLSQRAEMQRSQPDHYCNNDSADWIWMCWLGSALCWSAA